MLICGVEQRTESISTNEIGANACTVELGNVRSMERSKNGCRLSAFEN